MKTKIVQGLLLSASLAGSLMSCSKQDVQPATTANSSTVTATPEVKVINGRLVFADLTALNKTRDALTSLKSVQALTDWEKNLNFVSLRVTAIAESVHLEEWNSQGKAAPAYDLFVSFGFPDAYAAYINPAGEFQVGSNIYWFHDGAKYLANSEEELASIKQNPSIAKVKLAAGAKIVNSKNLSSRTTAYTTPYCDDKYLSPAFPLNGDNNSQRRIIYGINVYTEDDNADPSGFYHWYRTALNLFIKYEYQATRTGNWYPVVGQDFHYVATVYGDATPAAPYVSGPNYAGSTFGVLPTSTVNLNETSTYSSGFHAATLAVTSFYTSTADPYLSPSQFTWNFEFTGNITGYPTSDQGHTYTANASPLW